MRTAFKLLLLTGFVAFPSLAWAEKPADKTPKAAKSEKRGE